ncbi:hypothetical protein BC826DRAFT_1003619 [Russula brevipes]|nr:hypothetical protein BC826DRAFT_1003619 [Russula brevipes]
MLFDSDGQMQINLLGLQPGSSLLKMWSNVWNASDPSGPLYEMYECSYILLAPRPTSEPLSSARE